MLRYRHAERIAGRVLDGLAYVVAVDRQQLLELNDVATFLWQRLGTPTTVEELAAEVAEEFDVETEVARRDTEHFLSALVERGVVVAEDARPHE